MSSVESVRQKAISKLTRKYGKAYVRFIMNPRHSTNALIPQPVQDLTQAIQRAGSVAELERYEKAAEGVLTGRIQPTELRNVLRNEPIVGGGGFRRTARTSVSSDAGSAVSAELASVQAKLDQALAKIGELQETVRRQNRIAQSANTDLRGKSRDIAVMANDLQDLRRQLNEAKEKLKLCEERESTSGAQTATLTRINKTNEQKLRSDLNAAKDLIANLQKELTARYQISVKNKDAIDNLKAESYRKTKENEKLVLENERLVKEIQQLSQAIEDCKDADSKAKLEAIQREAAAEEKAAKEREAAKQAAEEKEAKERAAAKQAAEEKEAKERVARELAAKQAAEERADENDLSDLLGATPPAEPVKVEAAKCTTLPTGFVSAAKVEDSVMTKDILEFAESVKFDPEKILVYSNRSNWFGSAQYCPIKSVEIIPPPQKSKVTVMKDGAEKTFTIGTQQLKKEDFYVLKEEFEAYLNPDFRDDDDETTPAITGAGVAADEPTVTTASPVQETVTEEEPAAKVDYSNMKVTELKAELKKRGLKVSGLKSELVERLEDDDKEDANASDEKEESKEEDEESKEEEESEEEDKKSDLFGKPLSGNIDEVIKRGLTVKSKSGKLYKVTAKAKKKKFKGIDLATGKPTTIQIKGARINSLMARFEAFEGIEGLVPALPSIRIPERHEMM